MPFEQEFWEEEAWILFSVLFPEIVDIMGEAVAGSFGAIGFELVDFDEDLINEAARKFAQTYSFGLVSQITETTRSQLQDAFADWIGSGKPLDDMIARMETLFSPVRAEMVAVTETTRIYAEANLRTWEATGVVGGKKWHTVFDNKVCEICEPIHLDEVPLSVPFLGGDNEEHMNPPAHVRCRCWLAPILIEQPWLTQTDSKAFYEEIGLLVWANL